MHVLVSSSHLLPLLIKCILFKLQPHFAVDHLYSSARFGMPLLPLLVDGQRLSVARLAVSCRQTLVHDPDSGTLRTGRLLRGRGR